MSRIQELKNLLKIKHEKRLIEDPEYAAQFEKEDERNYDSLVDLANERYYLGLI